MSNSVINTAEVAKWRVVDRDEAMAIVRRAGREDVMVWFEDDHWACSECGDHADKKVTCVHVGAATRNLPMSTALSLLGRISDGSRTTASKSKTAKEAEREIAKALERGAEARARRAADHDETYVAASPVVVRQATPEDLERLRMARERKATAYEQPMKMAKFH